MDNEMFHLWSQPPLENLADSSKPRKFYVACGDIKTAVIAKDHEKAAILALTNHFQSQMQETLKNMTAETALLKLQFAQNVIVSESGFISPQETKDFCNLFKQNTGTEMCMDVGEFFSFWKKGHSDDIKFYSKNLLPEIIRTLGTKGFDLGGNISDNEENSSDEY